MIPDPELARFRAGADPVERDDAPVGIAVSGGPDSLALLLLAEAAWGARVIAATVDHRLRPESAEEAQHVARICSARGIAHAILVPDSPITGSLQAEARRARYVLLDRWRRANGAGFILTAHHADDQAETLLMRLNRGAGVGGLAGIRAINGTILRPLLGWRRTELETIVKDAGLVALHDPSNENPRFDRVRMRGHLADAPWLDRAALARSARHLAEADQALDWAAEECAATRLQADDSAVTMDPAGLPSELRRRLVLRALATLAPGYRPSGPELDRLLLSLDAGRQASIGDLLAKGGPIWRFRRAPARRTGN